MTWTMTLSANGQVTLPKAARDRLGAAPGDKIVLFERRGRFELEAYGGDILRWYGAFEPPASRGLQKSARVRRV